MTEQPIHIIEEITNVTVDDGEITAVNLSEDITIIQNEGQGPAGPPGDGNAVTGEIPTGTINGINLNFSLAHTPNTDSEKVILNGLRLRIIVDYTITSNTLSLVSPPIPGDILQIDYSF